MQHPAAPATPAYSLIDRLAVALATGLGLGFSPKAPGTFGSLPGLALGAGLSSGLGPFTPLGERYPALLALALCLCVLTALAYWSIARTERLWQTHDDSRIVVDEVLGQAIAICLVPPSWWMGLGGFALFRFFDITKPSLIGWIDRHGPGAVGTLFDDVLAGLVTAAVLLGARTLALSF